MRTSLVTACPDSLTPKRKSPVCEWASMRPGVMCLPWASMVWSTKISGQASVPMDSIFPFRMMIQALLRMPSFDWVQMVALWMRTESWGGIFEKA